MINNFKEQCFSEMIGSEAANKTDNNTALQKKKSNNMELTLKLTDTVLFYTQERNLYH